MFGASGGLKSRLGKAAGAQPSGQMVQSHLGTLLEVTTLKKGTRLWHEAHLDVKMVKTHHCRSTFGSSAVEKNTTLWHEAHVEVKTVKHFCVRALLEVEVFKKCTQLWREAKTPQPTLMTS